MFSRGKKVEMGGMWGEERGWEELARRSQIAVVASKLAVARHLPSGDQLQSLIVLWWVSSRIAEHSQSEVFSFSAQILTVLSPLQLASMVPAYKLSFMQCLPSFIVDSNFGEVSQASIILVAFLPCKFVTRLWASQQLRFWKWKGKTTFWWPFSTPDAVQMAFQNLRKLHDQFLQLYRRCSLVMRFQCSVLPCKGS